MTQAEDVGNRLANIVAELVAERGRQDAKFGPQDHANGTARPGDVAAAVLARRRCKANGPGQDTWRDILEEEVREAFAEANPHNLRDELVQIAAVAVAWVAAIDRTVPGSMRYCGWPGCHDRYAASDGAVGWWHTGLLLRLCPVHSGAGHSPTKRVVDKHGIAVCGCGWESTTWRPTLGSITKDWLTHITDGIADGLIPELES